ncbi:MAG: hypothetical protein ACYC6Z_04030 [Thermoleophilia bacterium]
MEKETEKRLIDSIKRFFLEKMDEDIGDLGRAEIAAPAFCGNSPADYLIVRRTT